MTSRILIVCGLAAVIAGCDSASTESVKHADAAIVLPDVVSFREHIEPVLSKNCFHCHGPDSKNRRPKDEPLRLDNAKDAFATREDGRPVIIKGKPAESALVKRIGSADPDMIMPPTKSHKTLTPLEIALIERWIEQGASYETH